MIALEELLPLLALLAVLVLLLILGAAMGYLLFRWAGITG